MTIVVNGEQRTIAGGTRVATIVHGLRAAVSGTAVALNGEVLPRAAWSDTTLRDGDRLEVLTAVQGG
jgi:sulfur carrier protein